MAKEANTAIEHSSTNTSARSLPLAQYPYLQQLDKLRHTFPPLRSLLDKLTNTADEGRRLVQKRYQDSTNACGGSPGRCAVLTFDETKVAKEIFYSATDLQKYLKGCSGTQKQEETMRRLFILEDLEPTFVDVLGQNLGVNPLVFSEHMNTWNFSDSQSVPHRALPSLRSPEKSFTLRYYEIRTLDDEDCIRTDKYQMTHAVNRRRIERWRDVDLPSIEPDKRHAIIRRCASFWTSGKKSKNKGSGWNALMLVDPPLNSCPTCTEYHDKEHKRDKPKEQVRKDGEPSGNCGPECLILEGTEEFKTRKELWKSRHWKEPGDCSETRHNSTPYHGGCPSLVPPPRYDEDNKPDLDLSDRNMASPFDEMALYWVKNSEPQLLAEALEHPVNSAHFFLKFIAQHWSHQLELIAFGVSNSEWFADDHEATIDGPSTLTDWKKELKAIAVATKDINYMRRQMSHFERAITLNIERLGVQLGDENVNKELPSALKDAQGDFLTIFSRLSPYRQRVDELSGIANEVASLRAAFKAIRDGEQGLRLSLFASIIFPLTLVASMLSMADGYLPGQENFFVFWAASVPLALVIGVWLMFGHTPERLARLIYQKLESHFRWTRQEGNGQAPESGSMAGGRRRSGFRRQPTTHADKSAV